MGSFLAAAPDTDHTTSVSLPAGGIAFCRVYGRKSCRSPSASPSAVPDQPPEPFPALAHILCYHTGFHSGVSA